MPCRGPRQSSPPTAPPGAAAELGAGATPSWSTSAPPAGEEPGHDRSCSPPSSASARLVVVAGVPCAPPDAAPPPLGGAARRSTKQLAAGHGRRGARCRAQARVVLPLPRADPVTSPCAGEEPCCRAGRGLAVRGPPTAARGPPTAAEEEQGVRAALRRLVSAVAPPERPEPGEGGRPAASRRAVRSPPSLLAVAAPRARRPSSRAPQTSEGRLRGLRLAARPLPRCGGQASPHPPCRGRERLLGPAQGRRGGSLRAPWTRGRHPRHGGGGRRALSAPRGAIRRHALADAPASPPCRPRHGARAAAARGRLCLPRHRPAMPLARAPPRCHRTVQIIPIKCNN